MKKVTLLLLSLCVLATGSLAREIAVGGARGPEGLRLVADNVLDRGDSSLDFEANLHRLVASDVQTPSGTFTELTIPGQKHSATIGAPALPVINQLVEVPFGAELEVEVLDSTVETKTLKELGIKNELMPRQPPQPKDGTVVPFAINKSIYKTPGFYQEPVASVQMLGALRHVNLALLTIAPVTYDPVAGKIEIYNGIKVRMHIKHADLVKTAEIKRVYAARSFDGFYKKVMSPQSLRLLNDRAENKPVHFVIVADPQFKKELAPFIAWKTEKGFNVTVGYLDEIGNSRDEIKAWLKGLYDNPGEIGAPEFVLFVGDNDNLPAWQGTTGSHITDLYYLTMTDGDNLPDVISGRFSAKTADQLEPQIAKTLEYEKYEFADPSFLERVTLIAGWDWSHAVEWGYPQIKYGLANYFNAEHGLPVQHVYLSSGSGQHEEDIFNNIDEGCAFVNYTAHGSPTSWADPNFTKTDIAALENTGKYPLVVGNCCLTNKFEVETCYGEAWLRAANKGAIGYIGGSNSTYWDEDLWWGCGSYPIAHPNEDGAAPNKEDTGPGAYDGVFEGPYFTNGGMMLAGNLAVQESNSPRKLYYWEVYHLMGDPSMMVYWGIPQDNGVDVTDRLAPGSTRLDISGPAGAYVGVTVGGQLYGAGYIGENGVGSITLRSLPEKGQAKIVVTGKNIKPYVGIASIAK